MKGLKIVTNSNNGFTEGMKICPRCGKRKPFSEFSTRGRKGGRQNVASFCKECMSRYTREWVQALGPNGRKLKWKRDAQKRITRRKKEGTLHEFYLKSKYKLPFGSFQKILQEQNGRCAICGSKPNGRWDELCVDHNHETGETRGLLCVNCNAALGHLKDNPEVLIKALAYLRPDPPENWLEDYHKAIYL